MTVQLRGSCQELLESQHGIIARWQVAQAGQGVRIIDPQVHRGRWRPLYRGVYATFTGPPSRIALLWAAVLRAGPGAVLSYDTAAELDRLADRPSGCVHVTVGPARQVTVADREGQGSAPKIVLHRSARLEQARHPARTPPRTRIEETTLDLIQAAPSIDTALAWLASACGRRLTTPELLLGSMAARPKLRWRAELTRALTDVGGAFTRCWSGITCAALNEVTDCPAQSGRLSAGPVGGPGTWTTTMGSFELRWNSTDRPHIPLKHAGGTFTGITPVRKRASSRSGTTGRM